MDQERRQNCQRAPGSRYMCIYLPDDLFSAWKLMMSWPRFLKVPQGTS